MGTPGDKRRFFLRQGNRFVQSEQLLDKEATSGSASIAGAQFAHGCRA